jgi:hypothetical protein
MAVAIEKQIDRVQGQIGEIKTSLALPAYADGCGKQAQILGHFLRRALQMSEASVLISRANLGTPLFVLARVLCEDLFLCLWVSLSEEAAAEYSSAVTSEGSRLIRVMLKSRRGHIWDKSSHEVKTAEFMPRLDEFIGNRVHIDQLALKLELGTVYDLVYRPFSMEVHGKAFGLPTPNDEDGLVAALSAVVSLVKAIGITTDNRVCVVGPPHLTKSSICYVLMESPGNK